MIIDDLVILGRGCPDRLKDGRETVCTAGYSEKLGFIRIYPTKITSPLKRWNIVQVEVDRDTRDTRTESWKIAGSKMEWDSLDDKIQIIGELKQKNRSEIIINHLDDCVSVVNKQKRSLGIIRPAIKEYYFSGREKYNPYIQSSLKEWVDGKQFHIKTKRNFPTIPKIRYKCSNCQAKNAHNQQVIDWGFYEWIRKNPDKKEQVWENAKIANNTKSDIYFMVGNQMFHRKSFVIISVFSVPKN